MRLLFATTGSLGDLYPTLSVAAEWKRRGHDAAIATASLYRGRVEAAGLRFYPMRPELLPDPDLARALADPETGSTTLLREMLIPALASSYADLERAAAAEQPHGLVGNDLALAVSILADVRGCPWASVVPQPSAFLSAYEPIFQGGSGLAERLLIAIRPHGTRLLHRIRRVHMRPAPIRAFRERLGIRPPRAILFEKHEADAVLALFSPLVGASQTDWPERAIVCGFPSAPPSTGAGLPVPLRAFLESGPPPLLFTLGDSAAWVPGSFFDTSVAAARVLGARALLVAGPAEADALRHAGAPDVFVAPYVPYGEVFGHVRAVVHAGGMGTIGLALRAGVPQLIVPHVHDQYDNAARVARAGLGRVLPAHAFTPRRAASQLRRLLTDKASARAREAAAVLQSERGESVACDALEAMLR
jgi:UDP:flavonoid glycosyltransferase YjiC (YdhE family)